MYTGNIFPSFLTAFHATVYPCVYKEHGLIYTQQEVEKAVYPCVYREHFCEQREIDIDDGLSLCIQGTFC